MIYYITLGTNDLARALRFYDAVLAPLGLERRVRNDREAGYAHPGDPDCQIWITLPFDGKPASVGNGSMPALLAPSRAGVDAAHAAGIAQGGTDEGRPGLRPYGPDFYACYLRDPDGNKLSAVCTLPTD